MKRDFNKILYNIKRLKPKPEDIEANKCHHCIDEEKDDDICILCGTEIERDLNFNNLTYHSNMVIQYLESMKMIANCSLTKKELKAAQKYFDMIPLLKNISNLYNICSEEQENLDTYLNEYSQDDKDLDADLDNITFYNNSKETE